MDNNEKLAQVYQPHLAQILVLFPIVWRHEAGGGDWHIRHVFGQELPGFAADYAVQKALDTIHG